MYAIFNTYSELYTVYSCVPNFPTLTKKSN